LPNCKANRLLQLAEVDAPPVPDRVVQGFPRVRVEKVYPLGVSGATAWQTGCWQILLNAGEPRTRQRFSAAHELKHVIDHPFVKIAYPPVGTLDKHRRQEQVADFFAATLLMPRPWVKRAWGNGIQDVAELADLFDVSREAMRYRLRSLGLTEVRKRCEVAA
jgi:Zn-dependent peptidase ImmA (M78 family)